MAASAEHVALVGSETACCAFAALVVAGGREPSSRPRRGRAGARTHAHTYATHTPAKMEGPNATAMEREARRAAAVSISRWWKAIVSRSQFTRMKWAVLNAETSMANEVLAQLCPLEAKLLKDPTLKAVLRFRFGGTEFPPLVLFKVFLTRDGSTIIYMSGKKLIRPASEAAIDACELMGRRKFMDQMVEDAVQQVHTGADENEISTMKEYMQYASTIDCQPAYLGGRGNGWRVLHTEVVQQQGLLYDLVNYFKGDVASDALKKKVPAFVSEDDIAKDMQISKLRSLEAMRKMRRKGISSKMGGNKRKKRLDKMRAMYGIDKSGSDGGADGSGGSADAGGQAYDTTMQYDRALEALPTPVSSLYDKGSAIRVDVAGLSLSDGEDEEEDESLFQWSQQLPLDELEM